MKDWKTVRLNEIAESVDYGVTTSATDHPIGPKFLRITDIQNGTVNWNRVPWCKCNTCSTVNSRLNPGDIVFARTGATTGKSFLIQECPKDAIFASYLIRVRVGALAEPRYISHFFQTPNYWTQITKSARGVAQPGVNATTLKELEIPLPPLEEQKRIADILDCAEDIRAKRRAALAQLDELIQSIFIEMFGDPILNPRQWSQMNLDAVFQFQTGKLDSNAAVPSGQYPFFTCSREDFRIDTYAFDCEALLLAGNNASADYSVKHYKGKFNAYQRTYVITLQDERNSYEYAIFVLEHRLSELKRISKGTNTKYLTLELLKRIRIPVPPQTLQKEFASRVAAVEKLKNAHKASLAELDSLFVSLQYRAFRGEL
ncbi:Type I restriction-modification system, specificity subunit S [Methanosarcina lacustris Z-7289]|uniref:Type I restriction-modification system, specificity subunit S n=1 Tax=Methanosarcina lacustris Z-7289 TaxID=1434111 RepID=A0A0E3S399_9EURY|nr:restriction endonuclease subunit S [Methanosarcina lacustris]AKB74651.1 Type I restriction-modification system, specificity subunit S [Methanosarcina lacustris Z-7289]